MEHLNFWNEYIRLNEMENYSPLNEVITFDEVVNYLKEYHDDGCIAFLGYGKGKDKEGNQLIEKIPLIDAKFIKDLAEKYVVFLLTVDSSSFKKSLGSKSTANDKILKTLEIETEIRNAIYSNILKKEHTLEHSYIWLDFNQEGILVDANVWGRMNNDPSWFVDGIGLYSEHTDEYQEYMDEEDEDEIEEEFL